MKNFKNKIKGFSFIEVIVTVSLFLILTSIGVGTYFRYYSVALINQDANNTVNLIQRIRFKALKNPTSTNYGIHINVPTRKIIGFKESYNPLEETNEEVTLDQLYIQDLQLAPTLGTTNEIIFQAQTGKTDNFGYFSIGNEDFTHIININAQGVVN